MIPFLIFLLLALAVALGAILSRFWRPTAIDRLMPTPRIVAIMAGDVGLVRRSGETASAFEDRVFAAHRELHEASTEFMNAAVEIGHFDEVSETYRSEAERIEAVEVRGRCITHRLPPDHPAAVRYRKAKLGDGYLE